MRTLMKCVDNGHFKQYEVETKPLPGGTTELRTSYGRIGGNQTVNTAVLVDDKAYTEYQRLVSSKTKKGYVIVEQEEPNGSITKFDDPTNTTASQSRVYVKVPAVDGDELNAMLDGILDDLGV
jgi:predicted DNA-binding WGR domain protein